jgi:hypothetical protein
LEATGQDEAMKKIDHIFTGLAVQAAAVACWLIFGTAASVAAAPASPAPAAAPAAADDPAKVTAARQFIMLFHIQTDPKYIAQRLDEAMPHMIEAAKRGDPKLDVKKYERDTRDRIMGNTGKILDHQARVLSRHFTMQELRELIAFCQSPIGRKLAAETPKIQQEMLRLSREERKQSRAASPGGGIKFHDEAAPAKTTKPPAQKPK